MCGVLLSDRHQKTADPALDPRDRGGREERLFDVHAFGVAEAKEDVAAKIRIDGCLQRDLDLADPHARAVFLGASLGREVADEITDRADVGKKAWVHGLLLRSHAPATRIGALRFELPHECNAIRDLPRAGGIRLLRRQRRGAGERQHCHLFLHVVVG